MTRARDVANLIGSGNYSSTTFTATAGQTAFTISHTQGFIQVFMNGLLLDETVDYTSNGSAVTLTSGAAAGDEIEVVAYNTFSVGDALNQAAADTRYVNTTGDTMTGNLTVDTQVGIGSSPMGVETLTVAKSSGTPTIRVNAPSGSEAQLKLQANGGGTTIPMIAAKTDGSLSFSRWTGAAYTERMRINNEGHVTMPYQPSFGARTLSSGSNQQDCVFTVTRHNEGNHYSTSTGRFTAPVAGTYLFGWTNIGGNTNDVYRYYIRVNGSASISGTSGDTHLRIDTGATGSEYGTNGMYTWPVKLSANDYVSIYYYADGGTGTYSSGDYAQFWGYLIG